MLGSRRGSHWLCALAAVATIAASSQSAGAREQAVAQPVYAITYEGQVRFNAVGLVRTGYVRLVLEIDGGRIIGRLYPADMGGGIVAIGNPDNAPNVSVTGTFERGFCRLRSGRGDVIEGNCGPKGLNGRITSFGLHQVSRQSATHPINMTVAAFAEIQPKLRARPFLAIADRPIGLVVRKKQGCEFGAQISPRAFQQGNLTDPRNALLPSDGEIDALLRGPESCASAFHSFEAGPTQIRFFPGQRPYFIDPFAKGTLQDQLATVPPRFDTISLDDALPEAELWRLISAYAAYQNIARFYRETATERPSVGSEYPRPTEQDMSRARLVAEGARTRAVRAILWQYRQMAGTRVFPLDMCGRYGSAQIAAGHNTQGGNFATNDNSASAQLARYNMRFRELALPAMLAAFRRIPDSTQVVDPAMGQYQSQIWQMIPTYQCVKDATGYVLVAASDTAASLRDAELKAAMEAARAEAQRQAAMARAARARDTRAAGGTTPPVDDDVVRAMINARMEANANNRVIGNTLLGTPWLKDSYNYETGIYSQDQAVQQSQIEHRVRNTACSRAVGQAISWKCSYDMSIAVTTTVFGMTLPRVEMPFNRSSELLTFSGGKWRIVGMADRIRQAMSRQAAMAPAFDHAAAAKKFGCISSNNFADQFGLVRSLDC